VANKEKLKIKVLDFSAVERVCRRIIRKMNNNTLDYVIQISTNSTRPGHVTYAVQINAKALDLEPLTWLYDTPEELLKALKRFESIPNLDKEVLKAYHKAQVAACKRTIQGHEDAIEALDNPVEETKIEETEDGNTEEPTDKSAPTGQ